VSVAIAVLVVGLGSLLLRAIPLLAARRLPDRLAAHAEHAGLAVLTALIVRAVVLHRNPDLAAAPLVALAATVAGLVVAYRGRPLVVAVATGAVTYVAITAALTVTT
jgi:branched-subunit amino acid transport protein